jgi:guanosine-3',5'-bis(diphosphate) 3'-pyrophosphohydrolase
MPAATPGPHACPHEPVMTRMPALPPDTDIGLFVAAIAFAAEKHRHQRRKDAHASPYINHPIALANVLVHEGDVHDPVVLCAAILHDTIEDTETTREELELAFGAAITGVVLEVTDDKNLDYKARKQMQIEHAASLSHPAKLVKLADKICNLSDLLAHPPSQWSLQRKRTYFEWSANVVAGLRGANLRLEATFDAIYARRIELE